MITCVMEVSRPPLRACRILPDIITAKPVDSIQMISPRIKTAAPVRYSFFVENLVMRKAVRGIMIPMASE